MAASFCTKPTCSAIRHLSFRKDAGREYEPFQRPTAAQEAGRPYLDDSKIASRLPASVSP
jgi:hypothetical protein